jgi:hypothetical protein
MQSHSIEEYSFGTMTVDGTTYTRDLIIFPDGIRPSWQREKSHHLKRGDLKEILDSKPEVLVLGTGAYGKMEVGEKARHELKDHDIELVAAPTGRAVKYFNRLQSVKRTVGAFHLTC